MTKGRKLNKVADPVGLGMAAFNKYWRFLYPHIEDVRQEVTIAALQHDPNKSRREFNNAVNRNLYGLARDMGYRKKHMNYHVDGEPWWEKVEIDFSNHFELERYF